MTKCFLATKVGKMYGTYDPVGPCDHQHALPEAFQKDGPMPEWVKCDKCGSNFEPTVYSDRWDTPSGKLEPGAMFWDSNIDENYWWDNHVGPHLCVVLPDHHIWVIDSRASNCDMKNNRLHRCWVRHGEVPNITVNKEPRSHTCNAGGGSILTHGPGNKESYHGFLRNGYLT